MGVGVGVGCAPFTVTCTVIVTVPPVAEVNCTWATYGVERALSVETTENVTLVDAPDLPLPLPGETCNQEGTELILQSFASPPLLVIVND